MVKGTQEDTILATIQQSHMWRNISVLHLTENMRLNHNPLERRFAHWLLELGCGSTIDMNTSSGSVAVLHNMVCMDQDDLI
jgi:hypothetical protein